MYTSNQASLVILGIKCCYFNLCIVIIVIFCSESVVGDAVLVKKNNKLKKSCIVVQYSTNVENYLQISGGRALCW